MSSETSNLEQAVTTFEKPTMIRWEVMWLMALTGLISYFDRINFSVAAPMIMQHFGIDKIQLGIVMSAFFIPYALLQIPSGMIAQRFGTRWPIAAAMIWWSLFTIFTPLAWGFVSLVVIRALFAVGESPLASSMATAIARWSNSTDKGKATVFMIIGNYTGPIVGTPLTVWIITTWQWQTVFYIYGVLGILVGLVWYWHHRDYPAQHPRINHAEVVLITEKDKKAAEAAAKVKEHAPWGKFLKNIRFWALGLEYGLAGYIMFLFLSWLPVYMLEARGMSMKAMGFAASAPWLAIVTTVVAFGWISDWMIKKGASKFQARSIPNVISLLATGFSLYMGANVDSVTMSVVWLTIAFGCLGIVTVLSIAVCNDIGKRFGGTLYSWQGFYICAAGVTAPILTPVIVKSLGWAAAMNFAAALPIVGALLFLLVRPDVPLPGTEEKLIVSEN